MGRRQRDHLKHLGTYCWILSSRRLWRVLQGGRGLAVCRGEFCLVRVRLLSLRCRPWRNWWHGVKSRRHLGIDSWEGEWEHLHSPYVKHQVPGVLQQRQLFIYAPCLCQWVHPREVAWSHRYSLYPFHRCTQTWMTVILAHHSRHSSLELCTRSLRPATQ